MTQYFNNNMKECNEEDAEYALLNISEYNGLRKVLRLYQATKENKNTIEKDNRYKVLEQQLFKHQDDRTKFMEWQTTLVTPYFDDLECEEVQTLVKHDLEPSLGILWFYTDAFDVSLMETRTSAIVQNYRLGKEEEYGIFHATLRYNGRNSNWELKIKSIKKIPLKLFKNI